MADRKWSVAVVSAEVQHTNFDDDVALYKIETRTDDGRSFVVLKRYSLISDFREKLVDFYKAHHPIFVANIPALPKKEFKLFRNHSDAAFVEERRVEIDSFFRRAVELPHVFDCDAVHEFLTGLDRNGKVVLASGRS